MKFLSPEWFSKVSEIKAAAGPIDLPAQIAESIINVTLTDKDSGNNIHVAGGDFVDGHNDKAEVTVSLTTEMARKLFLELDMQAGMAAFFSGDITVEGDVAKLMELQTYQPDDKQKALLSDIVAITE